LPELSPERKKIDNQGGFQPGTRYRQAINPYLIGIELSPCFTIIFRLPGALQPPEDNEDKKERKMENALGIMEAALRVRTALAEVMAGNIANADTPGYTAKTMDFNAALSAALENESRGSRRLRKPGERFARNNRSGLQRAQRAIPEDCHNRSKPGQPGFSRSEERRVGKECRS